MQQFIVIDAIIDGTVVPNESLLARAATALKTDFTSQTIQADEKEIAILPDGQPDQEIDPDFTLASIRWQDSLAEFEIRIMPQGVIYEAFAKNDTADTNSLFLDLSSFDDELREFRSSIGEGI
ncbi:hypothetical protein OIV19_18435 [Brucella sp. HL-2]|nr:hypothetical protein [Brucella sp. HL-2]MCV9909582.1 hypothetical protein [Brucella sp. HL-2]